MTSQRHGNEVHHPALFESETLPPSYSCIYGDAEPTIRNPLEINAHITPMLRLRYLYAHLERRSNFKEKVFNTIFTILLSIMVAFMYFYWHLAHAQALEDHITERVFSFIGLIIVVLVVPLVVVERMLDAGRGMDHIEVLQRRILRLLDETSCEALDAEERGFETVVRELEIEAEDTMWK